MNKIGYGSVLCILRRTGENKDVRTATDCLTRMGTLRTRDENGANLTSTFNLPVSWYEELFD
jgi:hypothetical protein